MTLTLSKPNVPIILEDVFGWVREGNAFQVRVWLDDVEHDLNLGDDHGFSLLHWAAKGGHMNIVDMLLVRGARINATNIGDDTALHLASAHGHRDIVHRLLTHKADVNAVNEHGNTPLHYACFWGYEAIAEDLIRHGASVGICNKYGDTPVDKCRSNIAKHICETAVNCGQDLNYRLPYRDQSWKGTKTRSRDATLSRYSGVDIAQLQLQIKISDGPTGELWRGTWQGNEIVARILNLREVTPRKSRDFQEEYPRLRIFSHPNVCPVLTCCNQPPNLVVVSQYMPFGSLYNILHEQSGIVVDHAQALKFAIDIARGMAFLHSLDPPIARYYLNSDHVVIDEDLCAKLNMADTKFSFQEKNRLYSPAWIEVPFADLSPMQIGMKIAVEGLRVNIPPGIGRNTSRLISICLNEEPGKRPNFDQVIPILEKMAQ
ncbi:ankyrin repeat protein [Trichinella nativa]|uniref:Ankyrin repeat protein n=1 Tax=Trichinella nativa TaxID=6335 RepID=A0A1Y3EGM0_9BILA|nr:ankyrin repeat protein [Trichinella nativa]